MLTQGSAAFRIYYIDGNLEEGRQYLDRIQARRFRPLEHDEDISYGWVPVNDILSETITGVDIQDYDYITLGFRVDRWKIPAELYKARVVNAEKELLEDLGRNRLSRFEKAEIRERIRAEMKRQMLATPKLFEVSVNLSTKEVRFTGSSRVIVEMFEQHFQDTFQARLVVDNPYWSARECELTDEQLQELADHGMDDTSAVLGADFLLWLWWRGQTEEGAAIVLEDRVEMVFGGQKASISGSGPEDQQALVGVGQGAMVTKGRYRLTQDELDWVFMVDATFRFSGVKLPTTLSSSDEDLVHDRLERIDELVGHWREAYGKFLEYRLSERWLALHTNIRAWAANEAKADPKLDALVERMVDTFGVSNANLIVKLGLETPELLQEMYKADTEEEMRAAAVGIFEYFQGPAEVST